MSTRPHVVVPSGARPDRCFRAWFLIVLFQFACATSAPMGDRSRHERVRAEVELGPESASVYVVDTMEPGAVALRPVSIPRVEFQKAVQRLAHDVRVGAKTPRQAAHALLNLMSTTPDIPTVSVTGYWTLEHHRGEVLSWIPEGQEDAVALTPRAEAALKEKYLTWCERRGGGDCLGLLDDGPSLRADDRRALALALALGSVLDETRDALARELLDVRALTSMVVWTLALYCAMWVVPEPTTKALAAGMTLLLVGYLGLETVYGLMDGWARLTEVAYHASTFEELGAAGMTFGALLGEDAAWALILAVTALGGHTLGQVLPRMRSLPCFDLAGERFVFQGGATVMMHVEATGTVLATEGALARAVVAAESVALSPGAPLAMVMLLKAGPGRGPEPAPGRRLATTVLRHRGGNRQVELSDGQRWHLPRGRSAADIPVEDKVGDMLQTAVAEAARQWRPDKLSFKENKAIAEALARGEYWLARLLEREARGRFVHAGVASQFKGRLRFNHQGVDAVDLANNRKYEILSGSESNLARHGRRMAGEFFRMLTF
ncbi:SitA5 family polymorphic toxin [Melittangium boletus]|uniref:SitA5 family polymorphic toxin n=1 Tax=Melittangium boletus TaxID=83453 RepID=UPI003DA45DDB